MEINQENFKRYAKTGVFLLFAAVAAPVMWAAVTGVAGALIAMAVAVVGYNVAPVVANGLSNWKYRAIAAQNVQHIEKIVVAAETNPIETLKIQLNDRKAASNKFKDSISTFRTEVKNFEDQIRAFGVQYPEDVKRFTQQSDAMNSLLVARETRYKEVQKELTKFANAIDRAEAMWKMSQAAQKMNALAGIEVADPFEKIKADSAINAVTSSMNQAFSEMETALLDNKEVQNALLNNEQKIGSLQINQATQKVMA